MRYRPAPGLILAGMPYLILVAPTHAATAVAADADALARGFADPPPEARLRAYWWWLNGNVTKAAITGDLEEMADKGFGGALICDAGGAEQDGNAQVPHGPDFFSPQWRELYKHALAEADRLGLEMSLNIQSGWNLGGPTVKAEYAPKKLVWSELRVTGPAQQELVLPEPEHPPAFYRDVAVLAYPVKPGDQPAPLQNWDKKALHKALSFSAPDTTPLLEELPAKDGEEHTQSKQVLDLTDKLDANGRLRWSPPPGEWEILRFGCTLNDHCRVSTSSEGWKGYALDPFDADAFRKYWQEVVEPLIADAGPLVGTTLKYLHTDSWEVEVANWTPTLREEFRRRRGYDLLPWLPVVAGRIVDGRAVSNRFLHDFRKTMGDLAVDNHFKLFIEGAHRHNLLIHPESGGPHAVPIDAQRCLGLNDVPMSEFWARSWRHRVGDKNRFFVKQPASAAHTTGKKLVAAEGFTTIGPHWQETLWDNLKPSFDRALCEGLNMLFWHAFTCSPAEMGLPGQEYFAGTHFNPNATWWSRSGPFLAYINRCQFMLRQGLFVADACYYYGDHVPNFAQLKSSDPAGVLPGYDYDVITEETLLTRVEVRDRRIVLPDGMNYRVLVLRDAPGISLPVLRKLQELVSQGATIIGSPPSHANGLSDYPASDGEIARIARELWPDADDEDVTQNNHGHGRVIWGLTAREVLLAGGVPPDFEFTCPDESVQLDYIHRRDRDTDIYFVANRTERFATADCTFRVSGRTPDMWDPVTGEIRAAVNWSFIDGRTRVPLEFAPYGSLFLVFRHDAPSAPPPTTVRNIPRLIPGYEVPGPWDVRFDQRWGGPESVQFGRLISWTQRPEDGIRFYSGTATYSCRFHSPVPLFKYGSRIILDLGMVKNLAEVRLNGQNLGILWTYPFRVDISEHINSTENQLEIDVVNFWTNRVIGDQSLPEEKRLTRTNIRKLTKDTPLVESGLLGPVTLLIPVDNEDPREALPGKMCGLPVSPKRMQAVYEEVKT
ncbi:MAG: hypothetical protein AMXMBFR13_07700, partial [Phycisphaerae bacterium]